MNLFSWQLTSISFPWSWINTIPWSCNNISLNMNTCIFLIWYHLQTANHSQLWVVTQTNINYDLLVLCVPWEQRPLVYPQKTGDPLKFAFSLKTSDWGCNLCRRLGKQTSGTKNSLSGIDISLPTPTVSLSVPTCALAIRQNVCCVQLLYGIRNYI